MEGGAMRGMFTAGVIDVMMEHGIEFDGAIGVSAGAAFGVNYKSRQIGRAIRYNERFCNDKRYCSLWNIIRDGNLYSKDFCYGEVPLVHDPFDFEAYEANPMEFHIVCTDIVTGKPHYHEFKGREDHEFDWIRASASMPLAARIVDVNGQKLLDGGVADSIPLKYFEDIGYARNVVVLTQADDYVKKPNRMLPLMRHALRKYPRLVQTMARRHDHYNAATAYIRSREADGACFVIRPRQKLAVGRVEHDPRVLQAVYNEGRSVMMDHLDALKKWLAEEK